MDATTELLGIVAISVAAHVAIAWTAIAYHTKRAGRKWEAKVRDEFIPNAVKAVTDEPLDVGPSLEGWLRSEAGVTWARELAAASAGEVVTGLKQQLSSAAGIAAREGQSAAQKLLAGSISFGNPMLDGLWAMVPPAQKQMVVGRLYKAFRGSGLDAPEGGAEQGPPAPTDNYTMTL